MQVIIILKTFLLFCCIYLVRAAERVPPSAVPSGWNPAKLHKRANLGESEIKIKVALSQRNLDQLESEFWDVSDPKNGKYGMYKSFEEVVDWVAPTQDSIDTVTGYFQEMGLRSDDVVLSASRDFMTLHMRVEQAEVIFRTAYEPYEHAKSRGVAMRMVKNYHLDDRIDPLIDFISSFNEVKKKVFVSAASADLLSSAPSAAESRRGSRATQASNGAPFLFYPWADYQGVVAKMILQCPGGVNPTLTTSGRVNCGSKDITKLNINVLSQITQNSLYTGTVDLTAQTIRKCSDPGINVTCLPVAGYNQLPSDSPYFGVYIQPLPLYIPYVISISASFSDGSTSPAAASSIAEGTDVASPGVIFSAYDVPTGTVVQSSKNKQSIVSFLGQSFSVTDLKAFFQLTNIPDHSNLVSVVHPENNNQNSPGFEASLDVQAIMGVAQNCPTVVWANEADTDYLTWIDEVLNQKNAPWVISTSYGVSELHSGANQAYYNRVNSEFQKAGVRGITLLYSSGDDGPYQVGGNSGSSFDPAFPASSPYVTAVGATQFASRDDSSCFQGDTYTCNIDEVVCSIGTGAGITTGGGFSVAYSRPSYQDSAVSAYLPNVQASSGANTKGRAYPDVAMIGHNAPAVINGSLNYLDGTSASSPYFAALVTLLNDIRLSAGKPTLGFLNPFIYSLDASAFNDITRGSANCSHLNCYPVGLPATPGWDAATGRGTPIFSKWAAAVAQLPANSANSCNIGSIFVISLLLSILIL